MSVMTPRFHTNPRISTSLAAAETPTTRPLSLRSSAALNEPPRVPKSVAAYCAPPEARAVADGQVTNPKDRETAKQQSSVRRRITMGSPSIDFDASRTGYGWQEGESGGYGCPGGECRRSSSASDCSW